MSLTREGSTEREGAQRRGEGDKSRTDGFWAFSDHQRLIRETVREFMEVEVRPHVKEWGSGRREFPL